MEQFGSAKAAFLERARNAKVSRGFVEDTQSMDQEMVSQVLFLPLQSYLCL